MLLLEDTFSPALNLALDDAILETAEASDDYPEVLRLWQPESSMVVIGRSSPLDMEVNRDFCTANDIPVFRRISGGQSIVTGPGCLMYGVLLSYQRRPELRSLDRAHDFVMQQLQNALSRIGVVTEMKGTCDLTFEGRKFSGNALRCRRNWFFYHGTVVLPDFDLSLIEKCLGPPKRQPGYRRQRSHREFVTSVPCDAPKVRNAVIEQWQPNGIFRELPIQLARSLLKQKYNNPRWLNKVT